MSSASAAEPIRLERVPLTHPDALRLVHEVQQEYVVRYGSEDESPISAEVFEHPHGAFFVGYLGQQPVAMGGWRRSDVEALGSASTAEVKRMFVAAPVRGRGYARQLLAHLERTAREAGAEVMVLETGTMQPEALSLYESSGYEPVPGFGHYRDSPLSRCYARRLADEDRLAWDAEAAAFDEEPDHGLRDPVTRAAWRALLLDVLPAPSARIADLGCGTGTLSVLLAGEGFQVTGLDFSVPMLEQARAKAEAAGVDVDLVLGDANRPGLAPGEFDVVLDRHVLWAMHEPADALRRWSDLLRPGGELLLVEGRWHTGAGLTAEHTSALLHGLGRDADVRLLPDPVYWGGPTGDERYLVLSRSRTTG